jgi:hypothetical protein
MVGINYFKTVILESQSELYQISDQWHQLQAMAKRTTVFQSWEWCYGRLLLKVMIAWLLSVSMIKMSWL